MAKNLFFLALIIAASGFVAPSIALLGGLVYGFTVKHPFHAESRSLAKFLLQASVIALGFGMNLRQVLHAGSAGFLYTALSVTLAMLLGLSLGRLFGVGKKLAFLISAGTAICGGSAIAAVGPVANANEEEIAMSLGTVFILNSVALFLFPWLGYRFGMTQEQFGLWSAVAIHDTSSVVGAAARFGATALAVATTVKLARALWIVPLSFVTAGVMKSKARIQLPWFILLFCVAAVFNSLFPRFATAFADLDRLGTIGLTATLFLIGTGLDKATLKKVGFRPLLQGIVLWVLVGAGTLLSVRLLWIHL
jgi:uncharacterized integral membrane protein (TIGR00698 family)